MPSPNEYNSNISQYQYIGDEPALGSLQLTMLARSFDQIPVTSLADMFPDRNIPERTIIVEQIIEGLGIMPLVRFGQPSGGYVEPNRIRSFSASPLIVREDDFLEMALINQVRRVGTDNEAWNPNDIITQRVEQLVRRHQRTVDMIRAKMLLGGVDYVDPRTNVGVTASSNIPAHNFFSYKGWNATVAAGSLVTVGGYPYAAARNLVNDKGRPEAVHFTSIDGKIGVPWTEPRADIIRGLHFLKRFLFNANKNVFTDLVIHADLLAIILGSNEVMKSYLGSAGVLVLNQPTAVVAGNSAVAPATQSNPMNVTFTPQGDVASLCGLRVRAMNGQYRNPVTGKIVNYWPTNKVAIVAAKANNGSETLGMTYHCSGEAIDGTPGMYMRVGGISEPPQAPGRVMQLGDAFLPVPIYPHWIAVVDVCEPEELDSNFMFETYLNYGTF